MIMISGPHKEPALREGSLLVRGRSLLDRQPRLVVKKRLYSQEETVKQTTNDTLLDETVSS